MTLIESIAERMFKCPGYKEPWYIASIKTLRRHMAAVSIQELENIKSIKCNKYVIADIDRRIEELKKQFNIE